MIISGDSYSQLKNIESDVCQSIITSPPYWGLRDYNVRGQIGLEENLVSYLDNLLKVFRECKRVLRKNGTMWVIIGDGYTSGGRKYRANDRKNSDRHMSYRPKTPNGLKEKDLLGLPWRIAFSLQDDGWYLRSEIIWSKTNPMPESVKDRPMKSHEYVFLFSKSSNYYFDQKGLDLDKGITKNKTVWSVRNGAKISHHPASFPEQLIVPLVKSSTKNNDLIMDPFAGVGTVGVVSKKYYRRFLGIELNPKYCEIARKRIENDPSALKNE